MKKEYVNYENLTKEILDSIKVGDLVKCNDWKKPMKVIGVSENYFLMISKMFRKTCYSVCDKTIIDHTRNNYTKGSFRIGVDDYIFGYSEGYDFNTETSIKEYLQEFESGKTQLSVRKAVDLKTISVK